MEEDDVLALMLMEQAAVLSAQTAQLLAQASSLNASRAMHETKEPSSSEEEGFGPGRGHTADGQPKATYVRREKDAFYQRVRHNDPDVQLFEKLVHLTRVEFDDLLELVRVEVQKPMNVRHDFSDEAKHARVPRKRRLDPEEMLFLFLCVFGGPNEGMIGVERAALDFCVSVGTLSNYFRHTLFAVFKSLRAVEPQLIRWPSAEEREAMEGLIIGFPRCVFFVDGNKAKRFRPGNEHEQERAYDGYKKKHCFAILVYCDLFGRFIRVEMTDKGAESDRTLYIGSDVYQNREQYLSEGQHGMADMGFAGDGDLVVPFKSNESTEWWFRGPHSRDIRKQRMVNEWGIGYLSNRHRIFLGRWCR